MNNFKRAAKDFCAACSECRQCPVYAADCDCNDFLAKHMEIETLRQSLLSERHRVKKILRAGTDILDVLQKLTENGLLDVSCADEVVGELLVDKLNQAEKTLRGANG